MLAFYSRRAICSIAFAKFSKASTALNPTCPPCAWKPGAGYRHRRYR